MRGLVRNYFGVYRVSSTRSSRLVKIDAKAEEKDESRNKWQINDDNKLRNKKKNVRTAI